MHVICPALLVFIAAAVVVCCAGVTAPDGLGASAKDIVKPITRPHALLHPMPIRAVTLGDGFWLPKWERNYTRGIPGFLAYLNRDDQTAPFRAYTASDESTRA